MKKVDCAIAEERVVRRATPPVLSIFVGTFRRTPEMIVAVRSLASQITGGLESKVEIVISDNDSLPEGKAAVRALADEFPTIISYYINARNEGGSFHIYAAAWRTTGRWTWTFGSDDVLFPGGVAAVLAKLESEDPSLLTMNKRLLSGDLATERLHEVNRIPDRNFVGFDNLFRGVGFHQVAFLSSSVERTEAARAIDPTPFRMADTYHNHVLAYFGKHRGAPCTYLSSNHLGHRADNSALHEYGALTAEDIGVKFPLMLRRFSPEFGLPPDFFEQVNGSRYIYDYEPPQVTFVDNMLEYMVRAAADGRFINEFNAIGLQQILKDCRPQRLAQFDEVMDACEEMRIDTHHHEMDRAKYEHDVRALRVKRDTLFDYAFKTFTDKKPA
jgi:hypothetical protein